MPTVNINGAYISGSNIFIRGNKIMVDGQDHTPDAKIINIEVHGNIQALNVDACEKVTVHGSAGSVITISGDVVIGGNVTGGVRTVSGDVNCGDVHGDIDTVSGDVIRE
ncbi:hypothetical protein [Acinetobacter sp.]|uniref:hypothetical protein n=1 Tax=Acinetobacter sp. TaxID=472 RepID=UPI00388FA538